MKGYSFPPEGGGIRAQCFRVIDGDTVDLIFDLGFGLFKQERVRLAGINAPEIYARHAKHCETRKEYAIHKPECNCGAEEERMAAEESKKYLQKTLEFSHVRLYDNVRLKSWALRVVTGKKGKYGRYIADIYYWGDWTASNVDENGIQGQYFSMKSEFHLNRIMVDAGHAKPAVY